MKSTPDAPLRCLLINPEFRGQSFWNFTVTCELMGAKATAPPLGLITVAALLPQQWQFRLVDLNVKPLDPADWEWADLICAGGMLPQQQSLRELIDRAVAEEKHIVVGGSDPSSQPHVYGKAHTLVVGEGEEVIPQWLQSWREGKPCGVFKERAKPDVTTSPTPRFDLLDLTAYLLINIQYSRGCPFNCEFCDIIELYGRKPRTKSCQQITQELDTLRALGYSGEIFIVDDNFIGNKANLTRHLLPGLIEWNRQNRYPFYYTTEASLNLMDDDALMSKMQEAEFRAVFFGIETPDPEVLKITQKKQNSFRPIIERLGKLYEHGMLAYAGFILGFDGEKGHVDQSLIQFIEDACINVAMVGFLVALPNTQLTRRLLREGRLLSFSGKPIKTEQDMLDGADTTTSMVPIVDQTISGLNFRTQRNRVEILEDFMKVVATIYEPKRYFDRAVRLGKVLHSSSRHIPRWAEFKRDLRAFVRLARANSLDRTTRPLFWRNVWAALRKGPTAFAQLMRLVGMYAHFRVQAKYTVESVTNQIPVYAKNDRDLAELDRAASATAAPVPVTPLPLVSQSA